MGSYLYDWLLREALRCGADQKIMRVLLGLNWSLAEIANGGMGLCFSPVDAPRTLPWPGTLVGRNALDIANWIRHWDASEAVVGAVAINALVNADAPALRDAQLLEGIAPGHLRVFEYFKSQIKNSRVAVIGRYPGLDRLWSDIDYQCIERRPQAGDLPDTAVDYVLPRADWIFITASSIANKTLPHLLALTKNANVVLMGPSLPWLYEWADYGVRYLAGVEVCEPQKLVEIAAEGGGTRIFEAAVRYRLLGI
jgi:uncharacterized protein (DUF4213/DUF364 family)